PPLPEQRRIATKLTEIMAEIEKARTACEKQLFAAKALPSAYLREVFESEEAKKWERKKLGEVCEKIIGGGTPSRGRSEYWNGNIFWLSPSELEEDKLNYVRETKEKITEEGSKNSNAKIVPPNSVLLSCTASVGKVAINEVSLTTNQQFNSFILKDKVVISEFVAYYLIHKKNDIKQLGGKTTFTFISKDEIAEFMIPLPLLSTQHRIVNYLKEKMAEVENLCTSIEKQLEAINALPQAYLRKAFRGEL
ncbi:MAG: restriction endonuclease subunit S, partial [Candidatus Omnitrophica bacterium]|nr:restriction endonuclease subunit S [Candidatus Omnitrophota bacterium]